MRSPSVAYAQKKFACTHPLSMPAKMSDAMTHTTGTRLYVRGLPNQADNMF